MIGLQVRSSRDMRDYTGTPVQWNFSFLPYIWISTENSEAKWEFFSVISGFWCSRKAWSELQERLFKNEFLFLTGWLIRKEVVGERRPPPPLLSIRVGGGEVKQLLQTQTTKLLQLFLPKHCYTDQCCTRNLEQTLPDHSWCLCTLMFFFIRFTHFI